MKYEKKGLKALLMHLRNLCADWSMGVVIMDEERMKSKEFKTSDHGNDYPPRSVPPSPTQLWLARATIRSLVDEQSPYVAHSMMKEADLPKETVTAMRAFYSASSLYPYLLNLQSTLATLADVSYLWMREFYLELCQRVQFPLSMSLPWILVDHVLQMRNRPLMPLLLAPLEAYNDAATAALRTHRQQYLYREIEAEVNLAFDQILFSLADQVYTHYKTRAALTLDLSQRGVSELEASDALAAQSLGHDWYAPLLGTRRVHLLGRSVDLAQLLSQRMNAHLRSSVETAVSRFEAKDLCAVVELQAALRCTALTHSLLAKSLPEVDAPETVMAEVNEATGFLCFSSRIAAHAIKEAIDDLLPHFAFRADGHLFERPPPTEFTQPLERDALPRAAQPHQLFGTKQLNAEMAMKMADAMRSFAALHAEALIEVLGEAGTHLLLSQLAKHMEELAAYAISSYVGAVQEALPSNSKLPNHQYGAEGCFGYFEAKLADLSKYEELHSGVMHNCRRLGNGLALLQLLEGATQAQSTATLLQLPPEGRADGGGGDGGGGALGAGARRFRHGAHAARQLGALTAPLSSRASMLDGVLSTLARAMVPLTDAWLGHETSDAEMTGADGTRAFHRVWSAVQFLFCTAPYETEAGTLDNFSLFGEGVPLAGCFLLHVLGQRHRFELFDFSSHVHSVYMGDNTDAEPSPRLVQFMNRVSLLKRSNERNFTMLDALHCPTVATAYRDEMAPYDKY